MVTMKTIVKKCAIYTRKSSDEGLDMTFNTLDAQRESCEAYIMSQRAEGWRAIPTLYDDGGYSGGNMDRPGLIALIDDIKAGLVDIVVVYKIDRLTRSLMDFAKLVEIFDEHGVTFVSVTQSFNTTTSMGRLTLNVLLSFAQFEREVGAERIRDKIAASKKKGMWMGGVPPLGYKADNRQLLIDDDTAPLARDLFERYLALGSVKLLKQELDHKGIISPKRLTQNGKECGGKPFSRGALHSFLRNPIYIGKIKHKDKLYDGQHEALIDEALWKQVQNCLDTPIGLSKADAKTTQTRRKHRNLLKGMLYDESGTLYTPTHTKKEGKSYRYYISQNLLQYRNHPKGALARLPAFEIEKAVITSLDAHVSTGSKLTKLLELNTMTDHEIITHINQTKPQSKDLIPYCINNIIVSKECLDIEINLTKLHAYLCETLNLTIPNRFDAETHIITSPFSIQRAHKGAVLIKPDTPERSLPDLPPVELRNLIRGVIWRDRHFEGESIRSIATQENLSESGVRKIIMGSFDTLMAL